LLPAPAYPLRAPARSALDESLVLQPSNRLSHSVPADAVLVYQFPIGGKGRVELTGDKATLQVLENAGPQGVGVGAVHPADPIGPVTRPRDGPIGGRRRDREQ